VEPATMPERTIIPWDKDDLDTLGFFKVDVLGLGMLCDKGALPLLRTWIVRVARRNLCQHCTHLLYQ